jgi:hypothetical protein
MAPLAYLLGLFRARLGRVAVSDVVVELGRTPEPGRLRDAPARALHDASLELAYWVPEAQMYVGIDGRRVEPVSAAAGMALENERLLAELRAQLDQLRRSRARIVEAGDTGEAVRIPGGGMRLTAPAGGRAYSSSTVSITSYTPETCSFSTNADSRSTRWVSCASASSRQRR